MCMHGLTYFYKLILNRTDYRLKVTKIDGEKEQSRTKTVHAKLFCITCDFKTHSVKMP